MHFRAFWPLILILAFIAPLAAQSPQQIRLVGAGTTSVIGVYAKWFQEFEKIRPDVHLIYIPSGSETGIDLTTSGATDFGGTDAPATDKRLAKGRAFQMATLLMAIVPVYNIASIAKPLRFSPQALAGIFLGTITRWNDPAIAGPNPLVQLPATGIIVIHSADGPGSTYIWSDYLSKVNGEWRTRVGRGINITWPVGTEAEGNSNLARMVRETPNSIGYVELGYGRRNRLSIGLVENAAGNFIAADISSITAAAVAAKTTLSDFRTSITNSPGERSYPVSSYGWMIVAEDSDSRAKQLAMKDFLRWMLDQGQTYLEQEGFAKPSRALVEQEQKTVEEIP
jgi:phosphate transport system substrate-binding protein